ncbi:THAP domain-containing protein 3-like [Bombina bombina]|uniref:THAP domain-containing protein 3-like n=1 Tax=Bombina bombina TaxID=8345 RepID=UPI00235AC014|nr:THAP domain-containing protein 3-like [Bombina bombina]
MLCKRMSIKAWKRYKTPDISLHCFPHSRNRIRQWLSVTGQPFDNFDKMVKKSMTLIATINYRICSKHFKEECFTTVGSRKTLRHDAVPTIDINESQENVDEMDTLPSCSGIQKTKEIEGERKVDAIDSDSENIMEH